MRISPPDWSSAATNCEHLHANISTLNNSKLIIATERIHCVDCVHKTRSRTYTNTHTYTQTYTRAPTDERSQIHPHCNVYSNKHVADLLLRSSKPRLMTIEIHCAVHATPPYLQQMALTSPTFGSCSDGLVRLRSLIYCSCFRTVTGASHCVMLGGPMTAV
jgi:hypothetical protein